MNRIFLSIIINSSSISVFCFLFNDEYLFLFNIYFLFPSGLYCVHRPGRWNSVCTGVPPGRMSHL